MGIGFFVAFYLLSALVLFTGASILYEKSLIAGWAVAVIVFVGALLVSGTFLLVYCIRKKKDRYKAFSGAATKVLFYLYLILSFVAAFKSKVILTNESIQKLVEIEWMVFSISITIFVAWHVIVSKFIEKHAQEPKEGQKVGMGRLDSLAEKIQYQRSAGNFFYSLILLFISMIGLVFITPLVYIMDVNYILQFFALFNINIIIDALMVIFYDISVPLAVELILSKKERMTDQQIKEEVELAVTEEMLRKLLEGATDEEIAGRAKEALLAVQSGASGDGKVECGEEHGNAADGPGSTQAPLENPCDRSGDGAVPSEETK